MQPTRHVLVMKSINDDDHHQGSGKIELTDLVGVGNKYGGHLESGSIQGWSFAELLHDLHHDSLSIGFVSGFVRFRQIESHAFGMFGTQGFHDI